MTVEVRDKMQQIFIKRRNNLILKTGRTFEGFLVYFF